MILVDGSCKNNTNGRINSTVVMKLTVNMWSKIVSTVLWDLFMVNFGKAVSNYIITDDDLCFVYKEIYMFIKLL